MKFLKIAKTMFVIAMFIRCFIFFGIAGSLELDNITVGEAFIRALANGSGLLIEIFLLKLTEQLIWEREDREKKMSKSEKVIVYPLMVASKYFDFIEKIPERYSCVLRTGYGQMALLFRYRKDRALCSKELRQNGVIPRIGKDIEKVDRDLFGGEDFEGI